MADDYGRIFRQMRESKQISMRDAAGKVCSKAQLSRFETGQSDLTVSKLFQLLENINVTAEEYVYALRDFQLDSFEALFNKVGHDEENGNFEEIRQLMNQERAQEEEQHQLCAIAFQAILFYHDEADEPTETDKVKVADYLFSVDEWGHFELMLFVTVSHILAYPLTLEFAQELLHRTNFYRAIPSNKNLIQQAIRNVAFRAIEEDDVKNAEYFQAKNQALKGKQDWNMVASVLLDHAIARLEGDTKKAEQILKNLIQAYEILGVNPHTLENLHQELKDFQANHR